MKYRKIICITDGHMHNPGHKDAKGVPLITHIKVVRPRGSQNREPLVERDKDKL